MGVGIGWFLCKFEFCMDHIFYITPLMKKKNTGNREIYWAFLKLQNTYDVPWIKLGNCGKRCIIHSFNQAEYDLYKNPSCYLNFQLVLHFEIGFKIFLNIKSAEKRFSWSHSVSLIISLMWCSLNGRENLLKWRQILESPTKSCSLWPIKLYILR